MSGPRNRPDADYPEPPATRSRRWLAIAVAISVSANLVFAGFLLFAIPRTPFTPVCLDENHDLVSLKGGMTYSFREALGRYYAERDDHIRIENGWIYIESGIRDLVFGHREDFHAITTGIVIQLMEEIGQRPSSRPEGGSAVELDCATVRLYASGSGGW
jgi:hypothetical protein